MGLIDRRLLAVLAIAVAFGSAASPARAPETSHEGLTLPAQAGGLALGGGTAPAAEGGTRGTLVVHATGDVNVDPDYIPAFRTHGYEHAWSGLDGLFHTSLAIVNLECPVSTLGSPVQKQFTFRCDPAALPSMREAGVDVANLANNHVGDYGPDAIADSRRNLIAAGVAPAGAGANSEEAWMPAILERNGWRVAVLGFGGVIPSFDWLATPYRPGMTHGRDLEAMTAAIAAVKEEADLVFVTTHWGRELETEPTADLIERGHAMIDAGADGVFGHHSHRLKPMSWYRGRPIAWGLGNFVWPKLSEAGSRTAVAEVVVHPDGTFAACLVPAYIASHGHPVLTEPYEGPCARSGEVSGEVSG